jgi:cysteine synthase B
MTEPTYRTLADTVGNTPLVRLQRLGGGRGNVVLAKLEGNNPAGSVKDRPALSMITEAEKRGDIRPGDTLIGRHRAIPASRWRWSRRSRATGWCW